MRSALVLVSILLTPPSCGGSSGTHRGGGVEDFDCKQRRVEYSVVGGFAGAEAGIKVTCKGQRARIQRWTLSKDGTQDTASHSLSTGEFEQFWTSVEGLGWRLMTDCTKIGPPSETDGKTSTPIYMFEVGDENGVVSTTCQERSLPFPYDRFVNELDLMRGEHLN